MDEPDAGPELSGELAAELADRRVLLTGATGFLGGRLCRALAAAGAEVHGLSRSPPVDGTGRGSATAGGSVPDGGAGAITWHRGDLTRPDSLARAVAAARPEVVFHLAAYGTTYGERDRERALAVNVGGSLELWRALEAADGGGTGCRLVVAGSCGEYGDVAGRVSEETVCRPLGFYAASKHAAVTLLSALGRESGREVVTLRPFGPYGPGDGSSRIVPHVIRTLLAGETVDVTAGEQRRDYAYVDDHVAAFLAAATRALPANGAVYNVGSGRPITLRELIEAAARALGDGALERVRFGALPYRPDETWEMCASIAAARRDLGYEPRVGLAEGMRRTVVWHRARDRPGES